ncbi:hypothetical protein [Streptomyces sp. CAU 1734]|uniref:hypothetical protein n=1 Tax=Streptomyces sp. CAU 1734 TaxID=3140360 RepID=UPI003260EE68
MIRYRNAAAVAAAACAIAAAVAGMSSAHAVTVEPPAPKGSAGEVDRNLLHQSPAGMLAPVTDTAGKLFPAS